MSKKNKQLQSSDDLTVAYGLKEIVEDIDVETSETEGIPMPFEHWFNSAVKAGKIRAHQEEAVQVFFQKQGLTLLEIPDTYNRVFKRF